jgi:hypothetical protein
MGPADVAEAMAQGGCSAEQIASTLRVLRSKRSSAAIRQANYRARKTALRNGGVTQGVTRDVTNPSLPPKKEKPPRSPLKEKTPPTPTLFSEANASLVDEAVDVTPPPGKKLERVESDERLLDEITDVWNSWARVHNCPQVRFLTKARGQRCRQRLKDIANGEEPIAAFRKVLSKCETSFFIRGSPRSRLKFDQLMREGFLSEMLEGSYEYQPRQTSWRR